jgi:hypothetical protein
VNFVSGARSWQLELPPEWEVSPSEWEPGFTAYRNGAALRVLETGLGDGPSEWTDEVVLANRELGRSTGSVAYGSWSGHLIETEDQGRWYRCWILRAPSAQIEVTYECPSASAGEDDQTIHHMLGSLTLGERPR